ncbi:hypothetical protein [Rhizobium sp. 1399]|uniref:hypothetical protein n=1 Tax=Rhizobium sp. 1399 TaxID=2817758 RepID=UPI002864137B|nr:hypothetical protein [Rhizobium sp. 1399]MDR6670154.1 hypothetical protein [Rhizobium sp. 1399]
MPGHKTEVQWNGDARANVKIALSFLMPHLRSFWERPLEDYAYAVYDARPHRAGCAARTEALLRLRTCIERIAIRSGATPEDAALAGEQLIAAPVIQTGPHCLLLPDPDAFYTLLFGLLGLGAHGLGWQIWCSASTVKFIESPRKGPGWLHLENEAVNVFGLPRRRMDSYNICGVGGPYRFTLSKDRDGEPANASAARLKAALPEAEFSSAADAIKAGNTALWQTMAGPSIRLLQFDDIDVADLWADHLEDPASWLSAHFFGDGMLAEAMLQALDDLHAGPFAGWIRKTTDLFWGLLGGRIIGLRLRDGILSDQTGILLNIPFTRGEIAAALRRRELVPNLLAMILVISILPGARVLGGCRQVIYYPLMRHVVAAALDKVGAHDMVSALATDVRPGVWGHRVLKPDHCDPFLDLISAYRMQPLTEACGDLASFTGDPLWASLCEHIAVGRINATSPDWPWAHVS